MTVHHLVAQIIIVRLKEGVIPWRPKWRLQVPQNYISKRAYQGFNQLLLSTKSYLSPYYITMNQLKKMNETVNRGERGNVVVFLNKFNIKNNLDEENEENITHHQNSRFILRYYHVWNIEQTSIKISQNCNVIESDFQTTNICESLVRKYSDAPLIMNKTCNPHYNSKTDTVSLPAKSQFESEEDYYSTLFHELIHSTGNVKRLARKSFVDAKSYHSFEYSLEELVAEIGAFMLSSEAGIQMKTIDDSASYISGWLSALQNNYSLIHKAASLAQKAVDYMIRNQQQLPKVA